jgi:hypothetical protein
LGQLNHYFIRLNEKDLIEFLLCMTIKDKNIKDIKLDKNYYKISCIMIDDYGDVGVSMEILEIDDHTRVIEF